MKIKNNTAEIINKNNNKGSEVSYKASLRPLITELAKSDSLASTIALEGAVTTGRGYHAYKRGGFAEFRERITDDVLAAFFWMKGVDIFNSLGDKFGQKVLHLPTTEFDVGQDALRTPFNNAIKNLKKDYSLSNEEIKAIEKKLSIFKFSKIVLSTLLAIGFVGFILPKINQFITKIMMKNHHNSEEKVNNENTTIQMQKQKVTFEEFDKRTSLPYNASFKGITPNIYTTVAHALENNKFCKLISSDVGILAGRYTSARNKDEGREYVLRDSLSAFGYYLSTPLVYLLLQKITGSYKATQLDPNAAKTVYKNLRRELARNNGSLSVTAFKKKTLGVLDNQSQALLNRITKDVISIKDLKRIVRNPDIIEKAKEMAKLQPAQAGVGRVLTKQQFADVLKKGSINKPKFMMDIYTEKFGDKLVNPNKFIPMKQITKFRDNIEKYVESIAEYALKKNNGIVDVSLLEKLNKRNFIMSAAFRVIGLGVSAALLGIIIPKIQYAYTAKRTGVNAAPGLRQYENNNKQVKENK